MEKEKLKELIIGHKEKFLSRGGLVRRESQDEISNYIPLPFKILNRFTKHLLNWKILKGESICFSMRSRISTDGKNG